jgi:hypothetical protein
MVITELDRPPDRDDFPCLICGQPMHVSYIWVGGDHPRAHWMQNASVHPKCLERYNAQPMGARIVKQEVPEHFRDFDSTRCNPRALDLAADFGPRSKKHILAVLGLPHRGKSRLLWASVKGFFDELKSTSGRSFWVSYFSFLELIAELDREAIARLKNETFVFVDDIGAVDCYGRERGMIQAAIRSRVQRNAWTFLTIDSVEFDPDLITQLRERAILITLDQ